MTEIRLYKLSFPGMLSIKAEFDNVDDMLEAKAQYEEDQLKHKNELDDIVSNNYYTKEGNKFILYTVSYYKYKLN